MNWNDEYDAVREARRILDTANRPNGSAGYELSLNAMVNPGSHSNVRIMAAEVLTLTQSLDTLSSK